MPVDAALQIAQHKLAARNVVRVVTQSLHDVVPRCYFVADPSAVGVELLPVLDKWLDQMLLARVATALLESPQPPAG